MTIHEIIINFNEDCNHEDSVCIGFDFICPFCNKLAEIEPIGIMSLFYIDVTYSRTMKKDTLIRCPNCKTKFKTIADCGMFGKTTVERVEKQGAT